MTSSLFALLSSSPPVLFVFFKCEAQCYSWVHGEMPLLSCLAIFVAGKQKELAHTTLRIG